MAKSVVAYTGLNPQILHFDETTALTAGESFKIGDIIMLTEGEVTIGTSGSSFGIALEDASGVQSTDVPVEMIDPQEIYVMKYISTVATAEALIGDKRAIDYTVDTTDGGGHFVETTTGTDVQIIGLHPDDGATTGGRLLVKFLETSASYLQPTSA